MAGGFVPDPARRGILMECSRCKLRLTAGQLQEKQKVGGVARCHVEMVKRIMED